METEFVITFKSLAILGSLGVMLAACSSTPVTAPAATSTVSATAPAATPAKAQPLPAAAPRPAPSPSVSTAPLPPYLDPKSSLSTARSVYFDFDDARLKSEFTALIEQHGKYLASNPALAIKVEGNTDERGSAEYNLALGQRRAQTVVKALEVIGVLAPTEI